MEFAVPKPLWSQKSLLQGTIVNSWSVSGPYDWFEEMCIHLFI